MAKMKRKIRRFDEGGSAYNPDQDAADQQAERDSKSFGAAFRDAKKESGSTFMWRGKRFTKDMAKPTAKPSEGGRAFTADVAARKAALETQKKSQAELRDYWRNNPEPGIEQVTPEIWGVGGAAKGVTGLLGAMGLGAAARAAAPAIARRMVQSGLAKQGAAQEAEVLASAAAKKAAARKTDEEIARKVEAASDRRTRGLAEKIRQEKNRERVVEYPGIRDPRRAPSDADLSGVIEGYKRGGGVKKFAKGGSIRGGGIESRGKTKGRFV